MKAYSHFVHISKFALSILIIILLVFLVVLPLLGREKDGMRLAFASIEEKEAAPPIMIRPKFQGVDDKLRPYTVSAKTATQQTESRVTLEDVSAELSTQKGTWLALIAEQGLLDVEEKSLLLQGDVQLFHDSGQEMRTDSVRIDLDKLNAFSDSPVTIQGNFGHIQADRFTILDKGDRILFNDNVTMLLYPQ